MRLGARPVGRVVGRVAMAAGALVLLWSVAWGQEASFKLTIREHRFEPTELVVPAGQPITLVIYNADPTPEEFESHDLNREKVIAGGATITLRLGVLKPGTYKFVGEFNEATAKGQIVVK